MSNYIMVRDDMLTFIHDDMKFTIEVSRMKKRCNTIGAYIDNKGTPRIILYKSIYGEIAKKTYNGLLMK